MRTLRAAALTLALVLTLSGCGASSGAASSGAADSAAAQLQSALDAAQAESETLRRQNETLQQENSALHSLLDAAQETPPSAEEDNPIDAFFDGGGYWDDGATAVMNLVGERYRDAWRAELNALAQKMSDGFTYAEDRALIQAYLDAAEAQVSATDDLAVFGAGADTTLPPGADRAATMGTIYGAILAMGGANVYRDAFFQLLSVSAYANEGGYGYAFDAAGGQAALDEALGR